MRKVEKKNIDWANLGFGYMVTDKRYVSNYKNGAWDEGTLTDDAQVVLNDAREFCSTARRSSKA